jgi:hypothetical protein
MRKATIIGAATGVSITLAVFFVGQAFGHGESGIGYLLLAPYFAVVAPTALLYRALGWEWHVGDVYRLDKVIIQMLFLNALIGALVACGVRKVYCVFKRTA